MRFQDIDRCLKCECSVTDVFGRSSETVSAVTSPILPGCLMFVLQGNDKCMNFMKISLISLINFRRVFFNFLRT